jgi:2-iminobutanoate/2-iminopropanoate deaminase
MKGIGVCGICLAMLGLLVSGSAPAGGLQVEHYSANPDMQLPFSDAVRVGDMLYLSGKIGNIPGTLQLAEGGIAGETRQALENIKTSLEKYGSALDEVVKCTVFLADIGEWGAMNEVYVTYFPSDPPARSALGSSGLALGARVEIECLAARR